MKKAVAALAILGGVTILTGCGPHPIPRADTEKAVSEALAKKEGKAPQSVSCPDKIIARLNESTRCTATIGERTAIYQVSIDKLDNGVAHFTVELALT